MNAIEFIKNNGVDKAREVVEGAPDRTASHYVVDTDTYFSEEFHTYFDHSLNDWETADLHCVSDLEANYEFVLDVSELKHLVESVELVEHFSNDLVGAKQLLEFSKDCKTIELSGSVITIERLEQAIADYEAIYSIPQSVKKAILNLEMHL